MCALVTGVQTCALPISGLAGHFELAELLLHLRHLGLHRLRLLHHLAQVLHRSSAPSSVLASGLASASPRLGAPNGRGIFGARRATRRASGKVSMIAGTRGCCMTAARRTVEQTSELQQLMGKSDA